MLELMSKNVQTTDVQRWKLFCEGMLWQLSHFRLCCHHLELVYCYHSTCRRQTDAFKAHLILDATNLVIS